MLREAEKNIQIKLIGSVLLRFYEVIADLEPEVVPIPGMGEMEDAARMVAAKDAHVLAAARRAGPRTW